MGLILISRHFRFDQRRCRKPRFRQHGVPRDKHKNAEGHACFEIPGVFFLTKPTFTIAEPSPLHCSMYASSCSTISKWRSCTCVINKRLSGFTPLFIVIIRRVNANRGRRRWSSLAVVDRNHNTYHGTNPIFR